MEARAETNHVGDCSSAALLFLQAEKRKKKKITVLTSHHHHHLQSFGDLIHRAVLLAPTRRGCFWSLASGKINKQINKNTHKQQHTASQHKPQQMWLNHTQGRKSKYVKSCCWLSAHLLRFGHVWSEICLLGLCCSSGTLYKELL